ncbi:MAG: Cytochrome c oxidase (B(O/a)3-type) chain I [Candidatus Carbobacillus altaicus]|uniref:Cytochrome c oxidase (B(O/a)3-type) chain I n=1 Tax=Candidatus Carbonibacillus altaicus TaxID=2163959 RepID=A0A2R6Y4G9_9BACL|nr:MAG: Cytochrome c oxidase (B(O/a)3-type) chain I [Candidatus Carbobacillus altaicus]
MITKQHTHVLSRVHLFLAFFSIALGGTFGLLQGLVRAGAITLPSWLSYYQILTAHGLLLALISTTYFIFAFLLAGNGATLGDLSKTEYTLAKWGTIVLTAGVILAATMILKGDASVLYTFYLPLQASPWFYVGLALFVIGTWLFAAGLIHQYFAWRKAHPGQKTPLFAFLGTVTLLLWIIASLGVAATVLFQMIPLSFGWVQGVNVELSRTLFWYFGHPLVYFWLLPTYMAWYTVMPRLIGGKLFSDTLARFAFLLFLVFSFPVGIHHQLTEPGIQDGWKFFQVILTFMVVIPSLMTAFNVFASLESVPRTAGQRRSLFGWIGALPWGDVRFLAMIIAMLFFIPGGIGGLVNASYQMNAMVHNTLFVVGHFHITVGTPVMLTFFAISYWLIPHLTGRTFTPLANRLGILQTVIWSLGMLIMSWTQHALGLMGAPRRTAYTVYQNHPQAQVWFDTPWANYTLMAIGGALLFTGIVLMLVIVIYLGFFAPRSEKATFPLAEARDDGPQPAFLENWKLWLTITAVLILIAYTVPIFDILAHNAPLARGMRTW